VSKSVANKRKCVPYDFVSINTKNGTTYRGVIVTKNSTIINFLCLEYQFDESSIQKNYQTLSELNLKKNRNDSVIYELFSILWFFTYQNRNEVDNYESMMKFKYEDIKKIDYERPSDFFKLYVEDFSIKKEVVKSFERNPWYSEELEK
jgi:hypothetical protein